MGENPKRTGEQLAREVAELRQRVAELETLETECSLVRDELEESQTELSAVFEDAPTIMILVDQERRVRKANRTALEFAGRPAEEVLGLRRGEALRCLHALDDPRGCGFGPACQTCITRQAVLETFKTGEGHHREEITLAVAQEGQEDVRRLLVSTTPLTISGTPMVLVSMEDITEQKRAEESLRQRTIELEERNAELDAFAHTAAHDLKNPLGLVVGYAEMLVEDESLLPDKELQKHVHAIARNARRMNNIIDELLLLAEARTLDVGLGPVHMETIVAEAQQRLSDLIAQQQTTITLPETWPRALGYAPWVEEVWVNYLSNAVKYSSQPSYVELGAQVQKDGFVRYWVHDNGQGLSAEKQARLFAPFTRLDHVRASGHGLGLSIVRRIVEKLGGGVGVESVEGEGSTFWFTLPGLKKARHT